MHKKIFYISAAICISSCTLGPDYQQPKLYSDTIIATELQLKQNENLPNNWYKNIGDTDLQNLIETGLKNNTDISVAVARLKQARLKTKIDDTDYLPQINTQGEYNYQKGSKNIEYTQDYHYYNAGFDASWELDIWGKGRRQNEADVANIAAQSYTLSNLKTVIAAEIAADYISLLQNKELLRLALENADLQKQIADIVQKEYESGLGDKAAYNQAQYLLQTTLAQIPQYKDNIEKYKNALSTLVGVLPSTISVSDNMTKLNITPDISKNMRNLPLSVIRLRPDVMAAEQNLKAQNALVGKAIADIYPNVNIGALFGYSAKNASNLFSSASETYTFTPAINMPLLDWNKLQNSVKLQEQEKNIALEKYKQSILNALGELKNAFSNHEAALKTYQNRKKALANIAEVNKLMLKRYHNGLVKFSDVLNSQQNLVIAQNEVTNAKAEIAKSIISYYKASGATIDN